MSLFFRNLFFTILHPGIVAGLIPYWIVNGNLNEYFAARFQFHQVAGTIVFALGVVILLLCIIRFAAHGKGTLSPLDPTKKLVISGLYRYSRNPMYIGVMLILIGEAIFFPSDQLWIYSLFIFFAFNVFIILVEEPRLKKEFADDYRIYCEKVNRWI